MVSKPLIDILRIEGIMAQGYGLNPKIVMRDKRLTPEAKCIYSYLSSFAGGGNQAFPGRDIMLDDLQMSKSRYYKHLKYLMDADYIHVDRVKGDGNIYGKNIYTLVALPNPELQQKEESSALQEEKKVSSAGKRSKNNIARLQVKKKSSVKELRERLEIDNLKISEPEHSDLIEEIFMAIEDMDCSEQIKIAGAIKKKDAIQELLNRLTPEHIRLVAHNVASNKKGFVNKKAYLQTCVANSIFDITNKKQEADRCIDKKKREEDQERQSAAKHRESVKQIYEKYPDMKEIDEQLIFIAKEMSKAILSGNEISHKKLKTCQMELKNKRDLFVKENGLEGCI